MLSYNEFVLNEQLIINNLYEKIDFKNIKSIIHRTINDLKLNIKFTTTFGSILTIFIPVVSNIIQNNKFSIEFNSTNVVLIALGAFSMLLDNNKDNIEKIKKEFKDNSFLDIIKKIVKYLINIKELFIVIAKQFGKVAKSFADMVSYAFISAPFLKLLIDYINHNNVSMDDFIKLSVVVGTGIAILAGKNIIEYLIIELSKKIKI